ncbi:MAG: argininosuccinate lyase [Deferribacteraceae bacterium]|jgi:argininosuccinate lyase|nr:argininosuccinate lyase [Deferribacteraceae bacterium]
MAKQNKLWAGRFSEPTDKLVEEFNASIGIDQRMALYDIEGSLVHAEMLGRQKIITVEEASTIQRGLQQVATEIKSGVFTFNIEDEDVHMAVERRLTAIVGPIGGKLHTARSRNDQVALDFRLYMRAGLRDVRIAITQLQSVILKLAEEHQGQLMPGYTHLQSAQPVSYAHYIMAYFHMLRRDYERMGDAAERMNYCPLGACALAGTTFPIDREFIASHLGFKAPTENSIDSVADRDFALEFLAAASICMSHLSRLSEELIIHSSAEFAFIELSDGFCTGSSIMPQKKNPDIPELIRGKSGRVYGDLLALLTTMKGLPLAYNKDMQEDKEGVFDALDTLLKSLRIFTAMLERMKINGAKMLESAMRGYSTATDLADYLVRKGLAFREAHHAVGKAVAYAIEQQKMLQELLLSELQTFSALIDEDVYGYITVEASAANRNSYGGTGVDALAVQLKNARSYLKTVTK